MTAEEKISQTNAMLDRIGEALSETGVTLEELIESGREMRGQLIEEQYGITTSPSPAHQYYRRGGSGRKVS